MTGWHIAVLIPARDEELLLKRCLRSISEARRCLPAGVTSDVIVVGDSCTDGTCEIARTWMRGDGAVIESHAGCVGAARALAAGVALSRCPVAPECCWLANTDADCEVPATWLADQLVLAAKGYTAVAGTVSVDSFLEHDAAVPERFRLSYRIHADGSHPHVHGANLGVRGDAYLMAGGWSNLSTAEDHDLWNRLKADGQPTCSDAGLSVSTSGRRVGRAPQGFAAALAAHNGAPDEL
jgi:cellulose synthase/poly-beta-1,6-N-acetylglucosamine synthase-like glycosyltransferase